MRHLKKLIIPLFLFCFSGLNAQIDSYIGVHSGIGMSKTRNDSTAFGFSWNSGITYTFWESPQWYIKSGLRYSIRNSEIFEIPKYLSVPPGQTFVKVPMDYRQQDFILPLAVYFPVYEKKSHAIVVMGGLELMLTRRVSYTHETYGTATIPWKDIDQRFKTGLMFGAGYQKQINEFLYLNAMPVYQVDIRSDRPFTSFGITIELFYGVY